MAFTESDWSAYVPLTIDNTKIAATMPDDGESGFPCVLVIENAGDNWEGDAANIFAKVVSYANDIAITLDDGSTQLKHDIVEYNGAGGSELLIAHILVPSAAGAADTILRLYYRDDGAADQQQTVYLAADSWKGYWPLQDTGPFVDLSDSGNDGTDYVTATGKTGKVGSGQDFEKDSTDYILLPDDSSLDGTGQISIMAWVRPESKTPSSYTFSILAKRKDSEQNYSLDLGPWGDHLSNKPGFGFYNGGWRNHNANTDIETGTWHMIAVSFDESTDAVIFYLDGATDGGGTEASTMVINAHDAAIGRPGENDTGYFDGLIDEVSLSSGIRSADWIATTYNCQNDNAAFWTVGSETAVAATKPYYYQMLIANRQGRAA